MTRVRESNQPAYLVLRLVALMMNKKSMPVSIELGVIIKLLTHENVKPAQFTTDYRPMIPQK